MMIIFESREAMTREVMVGGRMPDRVPRFIEDVEDQARAPASPLKLAVLYVVAVLCVAALSALGVWQLERRIWKLDLIERVNQRVHAAPVSAPGPSAWPHINAADDAYRHVVVNGRFLDNPAALVRAVTERGGYWVVAPFRTKNGFTVLVNRGFVPADQVAQDVLTTDRKPGTTTLTGLLRVSEPGGGFLRRNDPASERWYSRDVAAIAASRGIEDVAPYFIDADASADSSALPVGGLTVISFPNNHLIYAATWFGLAIMLVGWLFYVARQEWKLRKSKPGSAEFV